MYIIVMYSEVCKKKPYLLIVEATSGPSRFAIALLGYTGGVGK
jgi:hypothetical protein